MTRARSDTPGSRHELRRLGKDFGFSFFGFLTSFL
jgi:hypothetical protein